MSRNAIGKAGQKSAKSSGEMPQGRISKLTYKFNDYLNIRRLISILREESKMEEFTNVYYQRVFYTENTDTAFKAFLNNGNTGLGSSFISESYYCFGFLGIFVVFLLGLLMEHVTCKLKNIRDLQPYKAFSYFYLVYLLTFTVRSDMFVMPSSYFQYCFFPILIIWLMRNIRIRVRK